MLNLIISALWDQARSGEIRSRDAIQYAGSKKNTLREHNVEFSW